MNMGECEKGLSKYLSRSGGYGLECCLLHRYIVDECGRYLKRFECLWEERLRSSLWLNKYLWSVVRS